MKRLAPFAKAWLAAPPSAGLVVATGPRAWDAAARRGHVCLVLPDDVEPSALRWPATSESALILETGEPNDARLAALALELMRAGAPSCVALRESGRAGDPRVFFQAEDAA